MFRNHFIVAIRNIIKQKFYSVINIVGLSTGLAAFLLITLFINHELNYDSFHSNADRIVKANLLYCENEKSYEIVDVSPDILLSVFQEEFSEIAGGVRVFNPSGFRPSVLKIRDDVFEENGFLYADSTFFSLFSFHLIQGNPLPVLDLPGSIVLSRSAAKKYFPISDPMGAELNVNNHDFIVTGIMEDAPDNSTLNPSIFILAAPVSYVVMNGWLEGFQYRTPIGIGPVAGAFAISFIIALTVVSYQVVKAALADPVTVLKNE